MNLQLYQTTFRIAIVVQRYFTIWRDLTTYCVLRKMKNHVLFVNLAGQTVVKVKL